MKPRKYLLTLPVVISVHFDLAQVNSIVTEDSGLVNVRRRLLSLEPPPRLLVVSPEMVGTQTSGVTERSQDEISTIDTTGLT